MSGAGGAGADAPNLLYGAFEAPGLPSAHGALARAVLDHLGRADLVRRLAAHLPSTPALVEPFAELLTADTTPGSNWFERLRTAGMNGAYGRPDE